MTLLSHATQRPKPRALIKDQRFCAAININQQSLYVPFINSQLASSTCTMHARTLPSFAHATPPFFQIRKAATEKTYGVVVL